MNPKDNRIVEMYETLGLSIEDISAELNMDPDLIRQFLLSNSLIYRSAQGSSYLDKEIKLDKLFEQQYFLAMYAKDEATRQRAIMYLIDEKKGRHDTKEESRGTINIFQINQTISAARKAITDVGETQDIEILSSVEDAAKEA